MEKSLIHLKQMLHWSTLLIRLDVQLTSTGRELKHVQWAACVPQTNRATWVELGHWTQECLVTLTCHIAAFVQVDYPVGYTTARFLATNGFVWFLAVPLWKQNMNYLLVEHLILMCFACTLLPLDVSTITMVHNEHCQDCAIYLLWLHHTIDS